MRVRVRMGVVVCVSVCSGGMYVCTFSCTIISTVVMLVYVQDVEASDVSTHGVIVCCGLRAGVCTLLLVCMCFCLCMCDEYIHAGALGQ